MSKSGWTPSIVPTDDVYFVVGDLGRLSRVWCETSVDATDLETVIQDLLHGPDRRLWLQSPGRTTSRPTLPGNCAGAAIWRAAPCRIAEFVERHENHGGRQRFW